MNFDIYLVEILFDDNDIEFDFYLNIRGSLIWLECDPIEGFHAINYTKDPRDFDHDDYRLTMIGEL